jgi:hypothetical protein
MVVEEQQFRAEAAGGKVCMHLHGSVSLSWYLNV